MRIVIDAGEMWVDGGMFVPKVPGNADYERIMQGMEDGTIVLADPPQAERTAAEYRRAAEGYILARFSVLELMDMQQRLATVPNFKLEEVLQWIEAVKAVALSGSDRFEQAGEPPFSYVETLEKAKL